jgi:hypothetical protein
MSSSPEIGVLSFFQKFFLFGSSIWLLAKSGLRLRSSTLVVAVILFITSQAETFLPNRSAEITDTVMALLIGAMFALMENETRRNSAPVKRPQRRPHIADFGCRTADGTIAKTSTILPVRVRDREGAFVPRQSTETGFEEPKRIGRMTALAGFVAAAICLALAAWIAVNYPLAPRVLSIALLLYAVALWRWPSAWLAVVPAVLPALDLTPWAGWTQIGEPDLFVLVTVGILALRAPPRRADLRLEGFPAVVLCSA